MVTKYKEIRIWEFPPNATFVRLNDRFRFDLFKRLINTVGSQQNLINVINKASVKYNNKRKHSRLNLHSWIKGRKLDRGSLRNINIPLWVLIECSKILSKSRKTNNNIMNKIEENTQFYTGWGKSNPILNPKLPLSLTPEMISVIFHFLGDGHIGRKQVSSSYRQMNKVALRNFLSKLRNIFGNFSYSKNEFEDGRLNVPKIITEFYKYYFRLPDTSTFKAFVPENIKTLNKEFLVAGLAAFIIDEGHVDEVITIYSKNKRLIGDIRETGIKCGYLCHPIREKYAYKIFDAYRFSISSKSYKQLNNDLRKVSQRFPTINLAHKTEKFVKRIH